MFAEELKLKQKYERQAPPAKQRRSARLELKRQELEQLRLTKPMSSDDGSLSDSSDDVSSSLSAWSDRRDSVFEAEDVTTFNHEPLQPVPDHKPVSLTAMEGDVLETVISESNLISKPATNLVPTTSYVGEVQREKDGRSPLRTVIDASNLVSKLAPDTSHAASDVGEVQPPVKRKRGRPHKVRNETKTVPESSGNSAAKEGDVLETVISESNLILKPAADSIHAVSDVEVQPPVKRKRGRPRKVRNVGEVQLPVKRKCGRPRKVKRGRPRKVRNETETMPESLGNSTAMEDDVLETVVGESNLVSKPAADPIATTSDVEVQPQVKRKCGRPRKVRNETETMPESHGNSALTEGDVLETVISESSPVSKPAPDPIPTTSVVGEVNEEKKRKRKRGRPPKVRNETETMPLESSGKKEPGAGRGLQTNDAGSYQGRIGLPDRETQSIVLESVGESVSTQDSDLITTSSSTAAPCHEVITTSGPHPMTLSLSPPPMPTGKVPQPAGILLLPLYSSVPTEPGEQSSLVVVQPHQLANFPFAVGGHVSESGDPGGFIPPVLTPSQPIVGPLISNTQSGDSADAFFPPILTPSQPIAGPLISQISNTQPGDSADAFLPPVFTPSQPIVGPLISQISNTQPGDSAEAFFPPVLTPSQPIVGPLISQAASGDTGGAFVPAELTPSQPIDSALVSHSASQSTVYSLPSNDSGNTDPASSC